MKRIISLILTLALIITPMVGLNETSAISYDMTIIFDNVTVKPGETFDYALKITGNESTLNNLTISNCVTTFTDKGFKLNGISAGDLLSGATVQVLDDKSTVQISNANISGNGVLLYFNVTAPTTSGSSYDIKATITDKKTAGPYYTIYSGKGKVSVSSSGSTTTTYTINFDANGGQGGGDSISGNSGNTAVISNVQPTRTGYTFLGWSTSSTATTATYSAGQAITLSQNMTLYAVWKPITYAVSYNANGGNGAPDSQTKTYGQTLYLSSVKPTRSGYSFLGWSTSSTGNVEYSAGSGYNENKEITFYAVWTNLAYTVTYNANGGSGAPASQTKEYNQDLTLSSTKPTRTGYTFSGWSTSSTGTSSQYSAGSTYSSNADLNLYAVWKEITYSIKFNANGGSGAPSTITKKYNVAATIPSTTPTKPGNTFLGWNTSSTATTATYTAGSQYTSNSDVTLFAIWKANTYTVTYDANGGSGAPAAQTKTYGVDLKLSTTTPTRTGYTFQGWAASLTAANVSYQPGSTYSTNDKLTLYAVWKANELKITTQPTNVTIYEGETAKFTVAVSGTNVTYQWQYCVDGATWVNSGIAAAKTSTYSFTANTSDNMSVRCKITDGVTTIYTNYVLCTVKEKLKITTQPSSASAVLGNTVSFKVATNFTTGVTYQWQYSSDGTNWTNSGISAGKTSTYSFTVGSGDNIKIRCKLTDGKTSLTTNVVTCTPTSNLSVTVQPKAVSVEKGKTATFTVTPSYSKVTYQWQYSLDGSKWSNSSVASAKTASYSFTAGATDNGLSVRCKISDGIKTIYSNAVKLTVTGLISITTQPQAASVNVGGKASFTIAASGSGLSYQWQYSTDSKTWKDSSVSSAKTTNYTFTASASDNNLYVRCIVKNSSSSVTSNAVKLTVANSVTITKQPQSVTLNAGSTASFSVTASGTGLSYQWQWSYDGKTWNNSGIAAAKTSTYSFTASNSDNNLYVRCVVKNSSGSATSNSARLYVTNKPVITKQPQSLTVGATGSASFAVTATGSGLTYQWQWSTNNSTWNNSGLAAAKTSNYKFTASMSDNNLYVRCIVKNSYGSVTSDVVRLTVTNAPVITANPQTQTVNASTTVSFKVAVTGSGLSYQWQWSYDGKTWNNSGIASAKTNTYTFTATKSDNMYVRCVVKNSYGTATSSAAKLTVK